MADLEALADDLADNIDRFTSIKWSDANATDVAQVLQWITPRIDALNRIREDEKTYPVAQRDHEWLGYSKQVRKLANHVRSCAMLREAALRKEAAAASHATSEIRSFTAMKALLEEELGRAAYLQLWERIHVRFPDTRNDK